MKSNIKSHWVSIILVVIIFLCIGYIYIQNSEIKNLEGNIVAIEEEKVVLTTELEEANAIIEEVLERIDDLEYELDVCNSQLDDYFYYQDAF